MSGFSIDWLSTREGADRDARDAGLLQRARQWLAAAAVPSATVVDLGAGTGSTLRAFAEMERPEASEKDRSLHWRLVDQDAALLAEAWRRHGHEVNLEVHELDLMRLETLPLGDARLVTASALFDLVSAEFVEGLLEELSRQNSPQLPALYAALNYDGSTEWTPAHPLDATVLAAFNRDQQRDKGFGLALGPGAADFTLALCEKAGYKVHSASSPWQLDGTDRELVSALIDGIAQAVVSDPAIDRAALQDWLQFRQANVAIGTCRVGHMDLLALP